MTETADTEPVVELAAVGVAIGIVVVAANGRGDIPTTVIIARGGHRGGIGGGVSGIVLRVNGTYAAQGQGNKEIQALTFHQVSPSIIGVRSRFTSYGPRVKLTLTSGSLSRPLAFSPYGQAARV